MPREKFASANQKHYPVLDSDASSVWHFGARFLDVISEGNQWCRSEMSAVLSGYEGTSRIIKRGDMHTLLLVYLSPSASDSDNLVFTRP